MSSGRSHIQEVPEDLIPYLRVREFDKCVKEEHVYRREPRLMKYITDAGERRRTPPDYSGKWVIEVNVIQWEGPYTPLCDWRVFRSWDKQPSEKSIRRAKSAALKQSRFFRRCKMCDELNNAGHMHDKEVCQSCAERHLNVLY